MLDFPSSPTTNQTYTASNGTMWTWDGSKWAATTAGTAFLPLSGGTMTGDIVLKGNAAANLNPVPLQQLNTGLANRNKLINGDMRIDQRNAGASGTANGYTVDRWGYSGSQTGKGTWRGVSVAASGFPNALSYTSASAYAVAAGDSFVFYQVVEAVNIGECGWGTASALPATLSFWAYGSIAGTYGGSIRNNGATRSYPFSFVLAASTWTYVAIPIPGDTAGTWTLTGNGAGLSVNFSLGTGSTNSGPAGAWAAANYVSATGAVSVVGTNGAAFYITGVQFEFNSQATPFERRSIGTELALCQRYYENCSGDMFSGNVTSGATYYKSTSFKVLKRANPTTMAFTVGSVNGFPATNPTLNIATGTTVNWQAVANVTVGGGYIVCNWTADAEL